MAYSVALKAYKYNLCTSDYSMRLKFMLGSPIKLQVFLLAVYSVVLTGGVYVHNHGTEACFRN